MPEFLVFVSAGASLRGNFRRVCALGELTIIPPFLSGDLLEKEFSIIKGTRLAIIVTRRAPGASRGFVARAIDE
jgi:hypothetical protein